STSGGRRAAIGKVGDLAGGRLDGAVMAAGLGPAAGRERMIAEVNVLGVTELLVSWQAAFAAAGDAKVVVFG
ncbi:NAD-dependent epimerase, partial [Streptomyces sp. SID10244]|nr:NAD-dependent epimerase [Streptomyces sp. SID10244]